MNKSDLDTDQNLERLLQSMPVDDFVEMLVELAQMKDAEESLNLNDLVAYNPEAAE